MNALIRLGLVSLLCVGVTACVQLLLLPPYLIDTFQWKQEQERLRERCAQLKSRNIAVTEPAELTIPAPQGEVRVFERAYWQVQFESLGYPQVVRPVEVVAGMLVITESSVLWVSAAGNGGVRIPLEVVNYVHLLSSPYLIKVESCFGRLDIFTFGQKQEPNRPDPEATEAAAAQLKARVAAARAAAH